METKGVWKGWEICNADDFEAFFQQDKTVFWKIRGMDMDDACGRDNEGQPKFSYDVQRVNLSEVGKADQDSAIKSCGWPWRETSEQKPNNDEMAEMLFSYGLFSPMGEFNGNAEKPLRTACRRLVEEFIRNADKLEDALDRPVNQIGSTARDFGYGNITAGLDRYREAGGVGNATNDLMLKLHNVDPMADMRHFRADDPLAWNTGFMAGFAGKSITAYEAEGDLAPAFKNGFGYGVKAKAKEVPYPKGIKPVPAGFEVEK